MPDDFEFFASINVAAVAKADFYQSVVQEVAKTFPDAEGKIKQFEKDLGLSLSDISRVSMGMVFPRRDLAGPPDIMLVIKTRRPVAVAELCNGHQFGQAHESKIGSFTVRQFSDSAVCVPDSKTVLVGPADMMARILKRDKKASISAGMQEAMKKADYKAAMTVAITMRDLWKEALKGTNLRQELQRDANLDPELLTQLFDMSIMHIRIGSNVEIEAQVLGTDFKGVYSVSIKATTLANLISKTVNAASRQGPFGQPNFNNDWKNPPPDFNLPRFDEPPKKIPAPAKAGVNKFQKNVRPSAGVLMAGYPVKGTLLKGGQHRAAIGMEAGKTYTIDLKSKVFDSYLFLRDAAGNVIAEDDDSGGGLDARIIFSCLVSGSYQIEATSLNRQGAGAFELEVREQ
jgi:hypothetical protein